MPINFPIIFFVVDLSQNSSVFSLDSFNSAAWPRCTGGNLLPLRLITACTLNLKRQ